MAGKRRNFYTVLILNKTNDCFIIKKKKEIEWSWTGLGSLKKYLWFAGLFNFVLGCLSFFVLALWFMSFMYIAEAFGWIIDPTLDEGLLLVFLFLSIVASGIYFPVLISINIKLWKKVNIRNLNYILFNSGILIIGLSSFFFLIYSL